MVGPHAAAFMEHLCSFASSYIGNSSWECLTKGLLKSLDPGLVPAFQGLRLPHAFTQEENAQP